MIKIALEARGIIRDEREFGGLENPILVNWNTQWLPKGGDWLTTELIEVLVGKEKFPEVFYPVIMWEVEQIEWDIEANEIYPIIRLKGSW